MGRRHAAVLTSTVLAVAILACGGAAKAPAPRPAPAPAAPAAPAAPKTSKPPADHVKDRKGAMHKKGSSKAVANCGECHGADLRGAKAPSCYACHDKEWD
ncbi:MAG: hypothetical protein HY825_14795 [Acidobacteria bacterium]|nr:hypothetical protein [Acidobacteriota bacterium]